MIPTALSFLVPINQSETTYHIPTILPWFPFACRDINPAMHHQKLAPQRNVPEFPCPEKAAKALWSNAMRTIYDEIMEKAFGHIRAYTGITVYEYMICCIYTHLTRSEAEWSVETMLWQNQHIEEVVGRDTTGFFRHLKMPGLALSTTPDCSRQVPTK